MLRLIKFLFWLASMCALLYFAATVKLGDRTLIGHLRAIASTPEAKDLAEGTRKEAEKVKEKVKQDLQDEPAKEPHRGSSTEPHRGSSTEQLDDKDRHELDKVVRDRASK